eukprot:GHVL01042286.1.p1 GENE.GHVL01042286.1~~GHVL01042286.1.p1  ORF type:complete len:167 (+),score=22.07 GHVL01042286.1:46-546(+)
MHSQSTAPKNVIDTTPCTANDLKCLTRESCFLAVSADNELGKHIDRVMRMYDEALQLMLESIKELPDEDAHDEIEHFKKIRPDFERRVSFLHQFKQNVMADIPCLEHVSASDRAVAVKARAVCNLKTANEQYHISERASQVTTQVGTAVASAFNKVDSWIHSPKEN